MPAISTASTARAALDIRPGRRKIGYVSRAAGVQHFVKRATGRGTKHRTLGLRKCRRHVIGRREAQPVSFKAIERSEFRLTNAGRFLEHGRKHRREVAGSSGDGLQHLRGRGLLLERLPQFIEQPRVLDGDHGLRGERRRQFDFAVAERIDAAAPQPDHDHRLAIAHQRHADHRSIAFDLRLFLLLVEGIAQKVVDADDLTGDGGAADDRSGARRNDRLPLDFQISRHQAVTSCKAVESAVQLENHRPVRAAKPRRSFRHTLQHGRQLELGPADGVQHLRHRHELVARVVQFAGRPRDRRLVGGRGPTRTRFDFRRSTTLWRWLLARPPLRITACFGALCHRLPVGAEAQHLSR